MENGGSGCTKEWPLNIKMYDLYIDGKDRIVYNDDPFGCADPCLGYNHETDLWLFVVTFKYEKTVVLYGNRKYV